MKSSPRILVVDDLEPNRRIVGGLVKGFGYKVETARDGLEALDKLAFEIDLVLLDVMMPGLDGFEVTRRIRQQPEISDLPVIMVTGLDSREDRMRAVEAGANDFVAKPVDPTELRVRIRSQLRLKDALDQIKRHRQELEQTVAARTDDLRQALEEVASAQRRTVEAHLDTIRRLVIAAGFRDNDTAEHIQRLSRYAAVLAHAIHLPPSEIDLLSHAMPLHDVGKIGVPDAILLKQGPLTPEERARMNAHVEVGTRILAGSPSEVIQAGEIIARSHHEKWDGSGYPKGLAGKEIPLWGRMCAIVDVFDALTSNRPYRQAMTVDAALALMQEGRASHFDPELFDVFEAHLAEVLEVRDETTSRA